MGADFDATFANASIHIPRRAHDAYEDKNETTHKETKEGRTRV